MKGVKLFRRKDDQMIRDTWEPVLEKYNVPDVHKQWTAEYAHQHATFEKMGTLNEGTTPGLFFQKPGSIVGIGNPVPPTPGQVPFPDGQKGLYSDSGSGDKFPSLLPIAIQIAAKTQAFNLVSEIVMDAPAGFIPYVDYVYTGGDTDKEFPPFIIKLPLFDSESIKDGGTTAPADLLGAYATPGALFYVSPDGAAPGADTDTLTLKFIGWSRIGGEALFRVIDLGADYTSIKQAFAVPNVIGTTGATWELFDGTATEAANNIVELASALENQVAGYVSTSEPEQGDEEDWTGPFLPEDMSMMNYGMQRGVGEDSKYRQMGLEMHTKFVEAVTNQVAISATIEQIQDFNRVWNFDVLNMLENVGVNEIAQDINKQLMTELFKLGALHKEEIEKVEGSGIVNLDLSTGGGFENTSTLQRRLLTKLLEMGNLIHHRGRWGAGEYIVTNGRVASAVQDIKNYSFAPAPVTAASGPQLYPAGTAWGLQIYVDPNLKWGDNYIFIGRKGSEEEPGVKFMPYIMGESIQTIAEGTMSPKIAYKSRYAITQAGWHPETQYVTMQVDGLGKLVGTDPIT